MRLSTPHLFLPHIYRQCCLALVLPGLLMALLILMLHKASLHCLPHTQMALIGAVSGLIIALLVFMAFRLYLMRRHIRRLTPEELQILADTMGGPGGGPRRPAFPGVPPHIIDTFPTFQFDPATFDQVGLGSETSAAVAAVSLLPIETANAMEPGQEKSDIVA